jgi:heterotetrameric sarcosine oxidase delta subunit
MLLIICPHCGPRNGDEFTYVGEPGTRPDVNGSSPEDWRRYLYMRTNRNDWVRERWFHVSGCRRFLMLERHTASNEIRDVEVLGGEQA